MEWSKEERPPVLECKNLCKSYVAQHPVLLDFSCALPAGKIIGLLGPNGCGKSTIIKLVSGLLFRLMLIAAMTVLAFAVHEFTLGKLERKLNLT